MSRTGRYAPDTIEPATANTWPTRAACRGMGDTLFFSRSERTITQAKAICAGCPVRPECLAEALAYESGKAVADRPGVFGATTGGDRWVLDPKTSRAAPVEVADDIEDGGPPHGDRNRYVIGCRCILCRQAEREYRAAVASRAEKAAPKRTGRPPAACGTNSAYHRHVRRREPIDDPCRAAHSAADRRMRNTGTSKVLV